MSAQTKLLSAASYIRTSSAQNVGTDKDLKSGSGSLFRVSRNVLATPLPQSSSMQPFQEVIRLRPVLDLLRSSTGLKKQVVVSSSLRMLLASLGVLSHRSLDCWCLSGSAFGS